MTVRIAVRMYDGSKRLYTVPNDGTSWRTLRDITHAEVPAAKLVLVEVPK